MSRSGRKMHPCVRLCLGLLLGISATSAGAQTAAQLFPPPPLAPLTMSATSGPYIFRSQHTGVFNRHHIHYEATVAEAVIRDSKGPAADLYTISYVEQGLQNPSRRPVMFIFNGGPGASSVFLQLCSLGPEILKSCTPQDMSNPRTRLIHNPQSPLDVADLVFIDPTDTGWSRTLPGAPPQEFHSVDGDSDEVTSLVVWWLRKHDRLNSPVYIYGESYGSMRAVALVRDLARYTPKVRVAGLMLGGFAITFGRGNGEPSPVWEAERLPTVASLAWYYGKIDNKHQTWAQAVEKADAFARSQYVGALMLGYQLDQATRKRIIEQLPGLCGIPKSYFISHHTIQVGNFANVLLSDKGLVLDGDNGLWTHRAGAKRPKTPYVALSRNMVEYAARDLNVRGLVPYEIVTPNVMRVFHEWNFRTSGEPNLADTLSKEMRDDPSLRLMVVQGRYDIQTQVADTLYVLDQTDIPRQRLTVAYFNGGHFLEPKANVMNAIRVFMKPAWRGR